MASPYCWPPQQATLVRVTFIIALVVIHLCGSFTSTNQSMTGRTNIVSSWRRDLPGCSDCGTTTLSGKAPQAWQSPNGAVVFFDASNITSLFFFLFAKHLLAIDQFWRRHAIVFSLLLLLWL